ncbi:Hypothetical protein NTJ_10688 [Nesidiocoris tenuis]|uniref:Uncharacterized protein n=1 Tax=Nesidiocoris tenuis TaxID=355587 RepID=A0ABN7B2R8_9HEMI|nr:Hypothetical protein NTJ_10688 [Nesidiocoris tenuis]
MRGNRLTIIEDSAVTARFPTIRKAVKKRRCSTVGKEYRRMGRVDAIGVISMEVSETEMKIIIALADIAGRSVVTSYLG